MKKLKITIENETKQDKLKHKYAKYPRLDPNLCAFEDEETIETAQIEHIKKISSITLKKTLLPVITMLVICVVATSYTSFCFGRQAQKQILGQKVYITDGGVRYHLYDCKSIEHSHITALDIEQAQDEGYTSCKKCRPDRLLK